jgi:hypothetical protein
VTGRTEQPHRPGLPERPPGLPERPPGLAERPPGLAEGAPGLAERPPGLAEGAPGLPERPDRLAFPGVAPSAPSFEDEIRAAVRFERVLAVRALVAIALVALVLGLRMHFFG